MTTKISSLPNEIPNEKNVKVQINEMNTPQPNKQQQGHMASAQSQPTHNGGSQLSPESINQIVQGIQQAASNNMTSLPPKDIPMDKTSITHDNQTQPNYIPTPTNTNYIEEQDTLENMMIKNVHKKEEQDGLDALYEEIQTPVIIMILFLFFQMPYFQKQFLHYFPQLFRRDNNPTMGGIVFKSLLFGVIYYGIHKSTIYLSEL